MKIPYAHLLLLVILLTFPFCGKAAGPSGYDIKLPNTQSQMPVSAIHSVYRDAEGFLWYGTVNGLCRDDGYRLQVFRPGFLQAQDRVIGCMMEDRKRHIWLGSDNGLFWLDKKDYSISPLAPQRWEGVRVNQILPLDNELFLVQSRTGLTLTDSIGRPLKEYALPDADGHEIPIHWASIYQERIYFSVQGGRLYYIDLPQPTGSKQEVPVRISTPTAGSEITFIDPDKQQSGLWLLTDRGDVYHFSTSDEGDLFRHFACDSPQGFWAYRMRQHPTDGSLWVMNSNGVKAYRQAPGDSLLMTYSSMEEQPAHHMFADLWCDSLFTFIAAFDTRSFMLRPRTDHFDYVPLSALSARVAFNSTVMAMAEAGEGWWWVFQERTGLCLVHPERDRVVLYKDCPQAAPYVLDQGRIIAPSGGGSAWVHHDKRMHVYHVERRGESISVSADLDLSPLAQPEEFVTQLLEDASQRLWVGTNLGLYVWQISSLKQPADTRRQPSLKELASYPQMGYVSHLRQDERGHVWVSTIEGQLHNFCDESKKTSHEIGLPLSAFCLMHDGFIWLGTQLGSVWRYDPQHQRLTDYSRLIGLNGDRINQMQDDGYGHLWIETNQRILEFNPRNNASHVYTTSDTEIPLTRFLPTSTMRDSDGRICFGGIPGVIRFRPGNRLDRKANAVLPRITDIHVMQQSLLFDSLSTEQQEAKCSDPSLVPLPSPDCVILRPDDRDLEIFFSSLDPYDAGRVRYAYRMRGMDKDWKYTVVGENSAFYNQLSKGHYVFEVKATDSNGLWSDHVAVLHIERLPAFYETSWAYACYALLILAALILLILSVQRRDKRKNEEMWSDSKEMLRIRNYLEDVAPASKVTQNLLPKSEYLKLDQAFLRKVTEAVASHWEQSDFGVEDLAAAVNVSKTTLNRKLRSITGKSPHDFISAQKMQQACLWLQDKDRNITEIAISLGYSDRKYFSSCFKKEYGLSPSEFRKEKLGEKDAGIEEEED